MDSFNQLGKWATDVKAYKVVWGRPDVGTGSTHWVHLSVWVALNCVICFSCVSCFQLHWEYRSRWLLWHCGVRLSEKAKSGTSSGVSYHKELLSKLTKGEIAHVWCEMNRLGAFSSSESQSRMFAGAEFSLFTPRKTRICPIFEKYTPPPYWYPMHCDTLCWTRTKKQICKNDPFKKITLVFYEEN